MELSMTFQDLVYIQCENFKYNYPRKIKKIRKQLSLKQQVGFTLKKKRRGKRMRGIEKVGAFA